MRSYMKSPSEVIAEIQTAVMEGDVSELSRGCMFFSREGVLVTDDREEEFIPSVDSPVVVETQYAQELSWLMAHLRSDLPDVVSSLDRNEFSVRMAAAANQYIIKGNDLTGLLLAVLQEASLLTLVMMQAMNDNIRNELLSCAGSLQDLADRI